MPDTAFPTLVLEEAGRATAAVNQELLRELLRARGGRGARRQVLFDITAEKSSAASLSEDLPALLRRIESDAAPPLYRAVAAVRGIQAGDRFRPLAPEEVAGLVAGDAGIASISHELAPGLEASSQVLVAAELDFAVLAGQPLAEVLAAADREAADGVFSQLLLPMPLRPQGALAAEPAPRRPRRRGGEGLEALAHGGSGKGVLLGVVDFGCDFACPNFRTASGRTRLLSLWDQNAAADPASPGPGVPYGRAYGSREIDAALASGDPYEALGYRPHDNYYLERVGHGAHGTAMLELCAGNASAYLDEGPRGLAPDADLVFVQVALERASDNRQVLPLTRVLDGIRHVFEQAGDRPAVVNVSLNANGGPHDGLAEFDESLRALLEGGGKAARAVVVAAGNFRGQGLHARLTVRDGPSPALPWRIDPRDPSQNDLELWYDSQGEELLLELRVGEGPWLPVAPGELREVLRAPGDRGAPVPVGLAVGSHAVPAVLPGRRRPSQARFQAAVSLAPAAWEGLSDAGFDVELRLSPVAPLDRPLVVDLYLQRDDYLQHSQSRLLGPAACNDGTLGSLSCGAGAIVAGALDELGGQPGAAPQLFLPSSEGPTRDGRGRPEAYVGGVGVPVVRSLALAWSPGMRCRSRLVTACTSGTSASAARLSGALAARLQRTPRADAAQIRQWIEAAGLGQREPRPGAGA